MRLDRRMRLLTLTFGCLGLAACGAMQYVPKTDNQGGYSHTQLAPEVFDVHYTGSGRYDGERVWDFLLLRAAELCLDGGYGYFEAEPSVPAPVVSDPASNWIFADPFFQPAITRAQCYETASDEPARRLDTRFIVRTLREKYAL